MELKINIDDCIEDYIPDDEIQNIIELTVREYTLKKCEKYFSDCNEQTGNYKTLFESICLGYMLDNYKPEVDFAVDCCLKYITTLDLFRPRWYDSRDATNELFKVIKDKLIDSSEEFKEEIKIAILEKIKNTPEENLRELLCEIVDYNLGEFFAVRNKGV